MSSAWEGLIDGARDLDHGADVGAVLETLLTRFDACGALDQPDYAIAELLRALLAAWSDEDDDPWALGEDDDEA